MRRLAILVMAAALAGCGGAAPTPIIIYVTPGPTAVAGPTDTPTPEPTEAPTAELTAAPAPSHAGLAFEGDDGRVLLDPVALEAGLYRIEWAIQARKDESCFLAIEIIDVAANDTIGGLVSEMADAGVALDGSESVQIDDPGRYAFDVDPDGDCAWSFTLTPVR